MPQVGAAVAAIAATTAGSIALNIGASLVLSAASRALMPKPDYGSNQVRGRQVSSRQPVAPREIVYGRSRKGGTIVFMHTSPGSWEGAPPNAVLNLVIVVAAHQVQSIGDVYFNGELAVPASASAGVGRYTDKTYVVRRLGESGQPAVADIIRNSGGLWTANHRLEGCAYLYVNLAFDPDVFPGGIPNVTCDIEGKNDIYDPRTQTRGYTDNAGLCLADYMSLPDFGIGAQIGAEDGVNVSTLIEASNISDETVSEVGGATDRRYRCNGVVTLDQSPQTIIEAMLTSMAGEVVWQAGQWHIYPGAYRTPTLAFSSDDFAGDLQLQTRISRQENFNGVRGQFISPENDWQPDDFPAYQSAAYVEEDGGNEDWDDISLPFTTSAAAAQRLAKIHIERKRRQQRVNVPGKLKMWRATVGRPVNLTYDRYGFSSKPFDVKGLTLGLEDGALIPQLRFQETSPLVFEHSASEFQVYEAAPRSTLPSAFDMAPPTALNVSESLYQTRSGNGVKAQVTIEWTAAATAFVLEYQIEASLELGPWSVLGRTDQNSFTALDFAPGNWRFRVKALSRLGVPSEYVEISKEVFGLGGNPVALTGVQIQLASGTAILSWDLHPDLDVRIGGKILIRHSTSAAPSWLTSRSFSSTSGGQTSHGVPLLAGTYILRAEDSSGNLGPEAHIVTDGAEALDFSGLTTLTEDPAFSGPATNCGPVGSDLRLGSTENVSDWDLVSAIPKVSAQGGYAVSGIYEFASGMDFGTVRSVRLRAEIETLTSSLSDLISDRLGNVSDWQRVSSGNGGETDVVVQARTTQDDPSGSPVWTDWFRVDRTDVSARGVDARAILSSIDATYTPAVSRLRLIADEVS